MIYFFRNYTYFIMVKIKGFVIYDYELVRKGFECYFKDFGFYFEGSKGNDIIRFVFQKEFLVSSMDREGIELGSFIK